MDSVDQEIDRVNVEIEGYRARLRDASLEPEREIAYLNVIAARTEYLSTLMKQKMKASATGGM